MEDLKSRTPKPPTTFKAQLSLLKERGLIFNDEYRAILILNRVNYYRLSAYLLPFKIPNEENFKPNTIFENIIKIYEFDCRLRNIIMYAIEPIEVLLRTQLSYFLAHKYGALGYMNPHNFDNQIWHTHFMDDVQKTIDENKRLPFVSHHIVYYNNAFPIWVLVEIFSFGMLSRLYANMIPQDRKYFAFSRFNTGPDHLKSWLECINNLRNRCAHYGRLYFHKLVKTPRMPNDFPISISNRIFDILYIMKFLYRDATKWNNGVLNSLEALILEYFDVIDLT